MRIKAAFFTWSNKNPLVDFFVPFSIILLISRHYFPKIVALFWCCAVVKLARENLYMVNPLITPLTAQNCNPSWQESSESYINLRSGCIFVSALAVRENVWEPLKLGLISGYLRVFSFFISTGLWAPHLMLWHSLLLYLGSPCKISRNHCLDTF